MMTRERPHIKYMAAVGKWICYYAYRDPFGNARLHCRCGATPVAAYYATMGSQPCDK